MAIQTTDLIAVYRPGTQILYNCPVSELSIDESLATETSKGVVRFATLAEVIEGTNNQLAVSPKNLQDAFDDPNYVFDGNSGAGDIDYNDDTTVFDVSTYDTPDATESEAGIVRLATAAETEAGLATDIAITPAGLKAMLDSPTYVFDGGTKELSDGEYDYPDA